MVHVYSICYNGEVLLPYFLRHYETIAEKIIIYNNQSTDRTEEILKAHDKVEMRELESNNEIRDDYFRAIKNNCWKESRGIARLVVVCDIDEFLYHVNLPEYLEHFNNSRQTLIKPTGYNMVSENLPSGNDQIYDEIKNGVLDNHWSAKSIMFKPDAIKEINYSYGAHGCKPNGYVRPDYSATLLHYRYLSEDFLVKTYAERKKRLSELNRKKGWGMQYDYPEEVLREIYREHLKHAKQVVGHGITSEQIIAHIKRRHAL